MWRGEVARLPARVAGAQKVLYGRAQGGNVAFVREHGQGEAHGETSKWRERGLHRASREVSDRQHDFGEARGIGGKGLVEALFEGGEGGRSRRSAQLPVMRSRRSATLPEGGGDLLGACGVACVVEALHELAAQVVEERGGGEEMVGVEQREVTERPVRAAHAREGLFNGGGRALGVLGGREGRACRGLYCRAGRACLSLHGDAVGGERDREIHGRAGRDIGGTEGRYREAALHLVGGGAVHRGAAEGRQVGEAVVWNAHFDVGARTAFEHGFAREGEAHLGDAEAEGFLADDAELESVMAFKGAVRVEAEPGASFAVLREALDRADGRAEVSERGGVDGIVRLAVDVERRRAAGEHGLEVGARGGDGRAVEQLSVAARDGGDVERGLHATLDLEGGDAGVLEGVEAVVEA